jgi:hypothetical protein
MAASSALRHHKRYGEAIGPIFIGRGDAASRSRRIDAIDPKQASAMSGSRFLAPLIAELRRRIAGDRLAVAEPGGIE